MLDRYASTYTALGAPGVAQPRNPEEPIPPGQQSQFNLLRNAPAPMATFGGVSPTQQAAIGQHHGNLTGAMAGPGQLQAQLQRAGVGQKVGQGLYGVGLGALQNQLMAAKPWLSFMGGLAALPFNAMPDINLPDIDIPGIDLPDIGG